MKTKTVYTKLNASLRLAMLLLTILIGFGAANAATFIVTNTNNSGAGSLRQAVSDTNVNPGSDTINFNLTNCPCTINTTERIVLQGGLTINGLGAKQLTVRGDDSDIVFIVNGASANVVIDGLTITGGNAFAFGGGGISNFGTLAVRNSVVTGNHSDRAGGGILNFDGNLTVSNSTVSGNTAEPRGGGIANEGSSASLILNNSTVSGNTANGLNSITSPTENGDGGGIYNTARMFVTNSTITDNHAGANSVSPATLGVSGGIFAGGIETLNNTIVAGNVRGSIFLFASDDIFFGTVESANNNLIGNAASNAAGSIVHGVNGNIVGNNGVGTIDINSVLDTTLADNGGKTPTHALVAGSPAIDAGSNALAMGANGFPLTTDQRGAGFPRIVGASIDIGAFEFSNSCGSLDTDSDGTGDVCDTDDDNDGVLDTNDAFPLNKNESADTDHDGIGNNADLDDDGDGQKDTDELACGSNPLDAASKSPDSDGDNIPNCIEANSDTDGDGVADAVDNCPLTFNPDQADFDGDGIGDTCDAQTGPPKSKEQCQNNGWLRFNFPRRFKNQGDCFKFIGK